MVCLMLLTQTNKLHKAKDLFETDKPTPEQVKKASGETSRKDACALFNAP